MCLNRISRVLFTSVTLRIISTQTLHTSYVLRSSDTKTTNKDCNKNDTKRYKSTRGSTQLNSPVSIFDVDPPRSEVKWKNVTGISC